MLVTLRPGTPQGRLTSPWRAAAIVLLGLAVLACGSPPQRAAESRAQGGAVAQQPAIKRITLGVLGDPPVLFNSIGTASGADDTGEELVSRGLVEADDTRTFRPLLAEDIPTIENGLWQVFPDGRMQTTWRIKPGIVWHDGAPYTSADLLFTVQAVLDRELPLTRRAAYSSIEGAEAPDERTITVRWTKPYIEADTFFSRELALPLPKHILERPATEDKANFEHLPYWTEAFVGTGPFRLEQSDLGVPVLLRANERYVLGRPKIDEIEFKIFPDVKVLTTNILAGAADLSLGRGFDYDQAVVLEQQWRDGSVASRFSGSQVIYSQFLGTSPQIVGDVNFRRALLQAIDRPQLNEQFLGGRGLVSHVFLGPQEPEFSYIEQSVVRYDYDPRRAQTALEALGYTRGPDGTFRDATGERLLVELRSDPEDGSQRPMFAVADSWQRLGVGVDPVVIPRQRTRELDYLYTFPAFHLRSHSGRISSALSNYQSSSQPMPENRWVGNNRSHYVNADLDAAADRYLVTIPPQERYRELQTVMRIITDQLPVMSLYYDPSFSAIGNRLDNFIPSKASGTAAKTWNSHLWDVK